MSELPEVNAHEENAPVELTETAPATETISAVDVPVSDHLEALPASVETAVQEPASIDEPLLFRSFTEPVTRPAIRIPHFGHVVLLFMFGSIGFAITLGALALISYFHLFHLDVSLKSAADVHVILLTEGLIYITTFAICLIAFPHIWGEPFFKGVQWRGDVALQQFRWLVLVAFSCFLLAMLDGTLFPGPKNAPIEKMIRSPGAAWAMFAFGVTLAPFFEEMFFRGFLLPALCTAWDWSVEHITGQPPRPLDPNGHPEWSLNAMIFGSILTSLPFAGIHAEQQGHSIGPFVLLVVVSSILCAVRLRNRSLASSTIVHSCYNFFIFSLTFVATGGFRHLDKL